MLVKPEGKGHIEDMGKKGRIILKWILKKLGWEDGDCIDLVQGRNKWHALTNIATTEGVRSYSKGTPYFNSSDTKAQVHHGHTDLCFSTCCCSF
jgi:hypothetical protein